MAELTFEGGLNEQDDARVNPSETTKGYNFELGLGETHYKPRLPFDLLGTATNAGSLDGFIQLITQADVETTLVQAGDTVYLWDGGATFTSKGTVTATSKLRGVTWSLGGYSVITDLAKLTVVKKWDGTSLTTLTTGLGSTLFAKYGVEHLNRIWLFNVKAGTDTPHLLIASAFENPESYDTAKRSKDASFTTGNEAFFMVAPDLHPINGAVVFFNTLIISTEGGRLYKLTGADSTDFAFIPFYIGSSAIGTETMANIGDDMVYMRRGGNIESLRTTEQFGDVKTDDLSRWIPDSVRGLTEAITIYDQERQKVYFFAGSNKLLVLFKEKLPSGLSPWSIYKTDHASSFTATSAIYMRRPGSDRFYVYFGDSVGRIYQLEGTGVGDPATTVIETTRRSKYLDEFNTEVDRIRGRVEYKRISDADLLMDFEWADDYAIQRSVVPMEGPPVGDPANYFNASAYFGGVFHFNSGFQFSQRVSTKGFAPVGRGPGFHLTLTVQSTQPFDILRIRDTENAS